MKLQIENFVDNYYLLYINKDNYYYIDNFDLRPTYSGRLLSNTNYYAENYL